MLTNIGDTIASVLVKLSSQSASKPVAARNNSSLTWNGYPSVVQKTRKFDVETDDNSILAAVME
jgi:hypothetical protein